MKPDWKALYARYRADEDFRTRVSFTTPFVITFFDCGIKALSAYLAKSAWMGSMAFYYLVLGVMQLSLARGARRNRTDAPRLYRFYGRLLLVLTLALAAMSFHTLMYGHAIQYPGFFIYAAALSTFCHLTMAIVNLARHTSGFRPVQSIRNLLNLVTASVSLFFLQVSLLDVFGANEPWERYLNMATGAVVFWLIASMAVFFIQKSKRTGS